MRLIPSDPDVQTIVVRIQSGDIDLQPDFQRGEVWSIPKQRRLIDSILRDWHVPPIHVVQQAATKRQDVLDGQQRLVAIRDFVAGHFEIDGRTEPLDSKIEQLDGMRFADLPVEWKRQFNQFSIRFFTIVDFDPAEPAELFFRLNQPVSLTSAEQRNAFFGPIRSQVKELVDELSPIPIGFSNSRMSLDDVVARLCLCVESATIANKVTASRLSDRYRQRVALSDNNYHICGRAISAFARSSQYWSKDVRLNKATLFSWLWLAACAEPHFKDLIPELLAVSVLRADLLHTMKSAESLGQLRVSSSTVISGHHLDSLANLYLDRSSSRVSDVSSVIARDVFLWLLIADAVPEARKNASFAVPYIATLESVLHAYMSSAKTPPHELINQLIESGVWGGMQ